jgi:hypothetical protein
VSAIPTPLVVSAGDERFLARVAEIVGGGLVPVAGGAGVRTPALVSPDGGAGPSRGVGDPPATGAAGGSAGPGRRGGLGIEPGAAVGVQFVGGDANWTAVGTVTHCEGDRVLAFGHPLFGMGAIEVPMVGAYVHALLPLQTVSLKFASGSDPLGTFVQDRSSAVAGFLGPVPSTLPLSVTVREAGYGSGRYDFAVMRSRPAGSIFAGLASAGAVEEGLKASGPSSVDFRARLVSGDDVIEYETVFYTESPAFRIGGELSSLMDLVLENEFEDREVDEASLDVEVHGERRTAVIHRLETDREFYRPGDDVHLTVTLRHWHGGEEERSLSLRLPRSLGDGPLLLRVGGAASYHEWEGDRLGPGLRPRSFDQLLGLLDRSKPGNAVVAQILVERLGLSLSGDEIKGLPGRAALALSSGSTSGAVDLAELSVVAEGEIRADSVVSGYHELRLTVRSAR